MRRRHAMAAATLLVAVVTACRDVPAPESGVLSLSPLLLPAPAVVVGDTIRDSTGAAAPLRVIAYGVGGDPLEPQPTATFVVLDSGAHVTGSWLIGDRAGSTVKLVGSVAGIQTQARSVLVTLRPDTLVASDSAHQVRQFTFPRDTAATAELNVLVRNTAATPTGVDGVIVRYEIVYAPPVVGSGATAVLLSGSVASSRDTTAGGGRASRAVRLRLAAADPTRTDSAVVTATASYRGQSLGLVQFTIVFQPQ